MIDLELLAIPGMGFPMPGQRHVRPFHGEEVARERTGPSLLIADSARRELSPAVVELLDVSPKAGFFVFDS